MSLSYVNNPKAESKPEVLGRRSSILDITGSAGMQRKCPGFMFWHGASRYSWALLVSRTLVSNQKEQVPVPD